MSAISVNHERVVKAVAKLNDAGGHMPIERYVAVIDRLDQPGVIVVQRRPHNSRNDQDFTEEFRYTTRLDQLIGTPISYSNKYTVKDFNTMCYGLYRASEQRDARFQGLRSMERKVADLRKELEAAEANVAARKAELGL